MVIHAPPLEGRVPARCRDHADISQSECGPDDGAPTTAPRTPWRSRVVGEQPTPHRQCRARRTGTVTPPPSRGRTLCINPASYMISPLPKGHTYDLLRLACAD